MNQEVVGSNLTIHPICLGDGIGSHAGLRNQCRKVCGFDSRPRYNCPHSSMDRTLGYEPRDRCSSHFEGTIRCVIRARSDNCFSGVIGSTMDSKSISQGSSPWGCANNGPVAQLVERWIEDPSVGGSNPSRSTQCSGWSWRPVGLQNL